MRNLQKSKHETKAVIAKDHKDTARTSQTGCTTIHTIRDAFSGVGLAIPTLQHTKDVMYTNLKFFGGLVGDRSPGILVKSDAALSLTGAIHDLGWHAEPSLENRWPHNTAHERYHGTYKSATRASLLQSGLPVAAWHLAVTYASICLAITQRAPILPHMKDAAGNVLAEFTVRVNKTCWEVHHGEKFRGPMQPFGRLCFYLDKDHPLEPTTKPGIFIGWRLERGLRYRGVLNILDYGNARKGIFAIRSIQRCPVAEVYFPPELEYPFKNARELALKDCSDELKLTDTPIPFEIGQAEPHRRGLCPR